METVIVGAGAVLRHAGWQAGTLHYFYTFYTEEVSPMTQSTIHDDFTGYIHNVKENDRIIQIGRAHV